MSTCSVEGCETTIYAKGHCSMHYQRLNRTGATDLRPRTKASTAERFWTKVEKTEGCWTWKGARTAGSYGTFRNGAKYVKAHKMSWLLANGPVPDGMHLDHLCHNRGCVNPDHLRPVTQKQNNEHRAGARVDSKSGVRGVFWDKNARKWDVRVLHNYVKHYGGRFTSIQEAEAAAIALRNRLHTHNDADRRDS